MNNRYLSRGKRLDNGTWVEGSCFPDDNERCYIITKIADKAHIARGSRSGDVELYWVDPATIGQCTGYEFGGRLAFEGDIYHIPDEQRDAVIKWDDYMLAFMAEDVKSREDIWLNEYGCGDMFWIGTIYDNPELLGEEAP